MIVGTVPIQRIFGQFGPLCVSAMQHWGEARMEKKERKEKYRGDVEFTPLYKMYQHCQAEKH